MTLDVARWNSVSGWREHFLVMPLGDFCHVYEDMASQFSRMYARPMHMPLKCPVPDVSILRYNYHFSLLIFSKGLLLVIVVDLRYLNQGASFLALELMFRYTFGAIFRDLFRT